MPAQDQNSMVLNPSLNSRSSSDFDVAEVQMPPLVPVQQDDHVPDGDALAIVVYTLPTIQLPLMENARVVLGPVLPPSMIWEKIFDNLLPSIAVQSIPTFVPSFPSPQPPVRDWIDLLHLKCPL